MTTSSTTFNSTLFDGAPYYYARYRPKYPPELYQKLVEGFNLDGTGQLLDLGCGTGLISIALRNQFEQVIGLDPDPAMLAEAKQAAIAVDATNIAWLEQSAEQIGSELGRFKLITIGRAFHWMDRPLVIEHSYDLLDSGGALVLLATQGEDPWRNQTPWKQSALAVVKKWLGERRRAGQGWWVDPNPTHAELLDQSNFPHQIRYQAAYEQIWTIDSFIGYLYSTAFCLRSFLSDPIAFENELRETLLAINPTGEFAEKITASALAAVK